MPIQVGERLPQVTFRIMTPDGPVAKTTDDLFKGRKGKTKFEVYDSAMTLSTTAVSCYRSDFKSPYTNKSTQLSGSVKFKGAPANVGYVDVYQNGNAAGGATQFAKLSAGLAMTAAEFFVV